MQITLSKAIFAKLVVTLSEDVTKRPPIFLHRWIARTRLHWVPRLHRVTFLVVFEKCLPEGFSCYFDRNCHFLINSCRNASETKAWGLGTFTWKPDSLRRNFAWLRTSSSSTTSCFFDSAHVMSGKHQDPCLTLPPSRRWCITNHDAGKSDWEIQHKLDATWEVICLSMNKDLRV